MARKPAEKPKDEPAELTAIDIERAEQARVEAALNEGEKARNIKIVAGKA